MQPAQTTASSGQGVLFVSRDPVIHQAGGSTTGIFKLLETLIAAGMDVTMLVTLAYGRSPRPGFRAKVPLPEGVKVVVPGYFRFGSYYLRPYALKPWARAVVRASTRRTWLQPFARVAKWIWGDSVYSEAWDLTLATKAEVSVTRKYLRSHAASTVISNYVIWAPLFERMGQGAVKRVIMTHDLLSARTRMILEAGQPLDSPAVDEATELQWMSTADVVLASQAREAEFLRERLRVQVVEQPILLKDCSSTAAVEANHCLFVGTRILPNVTGLEFFLREVWPLIRAKNPHATLGVAGSICNVAVEGLDAPGVQSLGFVPSLAAEYERAAVCVVPLTVGSGIKIKLLEAASFGKAIVTTSVGAQGLEDWAAGAMIVADAPEAFAEAVVTLLASESARQELEQGARRLVREHFSLQSESTQNFLRMLPQENSDPAQSIL